MIEDVNDENMTYETEPTPAHPMQVAALKEANARLAARVMELERENAELRKAYEPVEKAFRVVWTACAFGYEGTPVGEAFNHIKAWFDGVKL